MCTIIILQRAHPSHPLVIAANRDELYARSATGPILLAKAPRTIGGLDKQSGGTWMGVTENGLFAGLTNQRTYRHSDPTLHSRGKLVLDVLRAKTTDGVTRMLDALDPRQYNPFNLLYGDAAGLRVAYARADRAHIEFENIPDGVHILPNDRLNSSRFPKVERAQQLVRTDAPIEQLAGPLADHALPPIDVVEHPPDGSPFPLTLLHSLQALCIHTPNYGTRSSTIVALEPGGVATYLFADGPPCTTEFSDVSGLLR